MKFERKYSEITYKGKKYQVGSLNVSQTINMRSRFRRADVQNDEVGAIELMVDFLAMSLTKPKMTSKTLQEGLSLDELHSLFEKVAIIQGFLEPKNAPKRKPRQKKN